MAEFTVVEEAPISITHLKEQLDALDKEKTLTFRGEKTKAYLENFVTGKSKDVDALVKTIQELNIPRLKDRHIVKIIDVMPTDLDSLKILMSGEVLTINDDDLKKILDVIPQ